MRTSIIIALFVFCLVSCQQEKVQYDLVIHGSNIYPVAEFDKVMTYLVINDEKIVEVGYDDGWKKIEAIEVIDAEDNFVMPGFIEGHGHFSGLGNLLLDLNFLETRSWEEILGMIEEKVKTMEPGEWIIGRGWHQEKWDSIPKINIDNYPHHNSLSEITKNNPVLLTHASGHSVYANDKAMELAGVKLETPDPAGGKIVRDDSGNAIGVFEERAMSVLREAHQEYIASLDQDEVLQKWYDAIALAQKECLSNGITSFQDAGSKFGEIDRYTRMAEDGLFDVRLWAMVRHSSDEMKNQLQKIKVVGDYFTCNAIKSEVDGALGAFGAWLLEEYSDKPGFHGQNTTDIYEVKAIADLALANDMQFCVHAIGDRANRVVVDIFEGMKGISTKEDMRWRIEHAQHLNPQDIPRFEANGIIASMQGIHCTSDAPFVEKRLGKDRAQSGAYAWRSLIDSGVKIANGTDAPVEDIDPIKNFYATVTRKRIDNGMEFYTEQAMTREEAVKSYTIWNAYAAFEDESKGTLEVGKLGDIVILSNDLINCSDEDILDTEVLYTIVGGEVKYHKD